MLAFLIIFVPIVGGLVSIGIAQAGPKWRNRFVLLISALTVLLSVYLLIFMQAQGPVTFSYPRLLPPFGISFQIDWLSVILIMIASSIWLLATVYSFDYMQESKNQTRYHATSLVTLGATIGTFLAGDLVTMFLFFELMSLASFVLVIHEGSPAAMKAGYLYLIMTIGGGLALLFGIIAVYQLTGTVAFAASGYLATNSSLAMGALIAFMIGFGMKAGMFPLHVWLPEAHPVAPSPASALLSGVMLKVGAFGLIRTGFNVFNFQFLADVGWNNYLLIGAGLTILLGSVFAIMQKNLKRRLAYSSVAQMGYILLGIALLSETAMVGDIFHIFTHAIMKSCLFLVAGAMILKTGKTEIDDFKGVGRRMPISMVCFTMASLSMIGIPPFNGFLSKWLLGLGAMETGRFAYTIILLISSLLNAVYYMPIVINAFFRKEEHDFSAVKDPSMGMLLPVMILAAATVLFDLLPVNVLFEFSEITATALFGGGL